MPMERHHPYPFPTAEDVDAAPGDRETKAARNIMVRHIEGLVRRPFLLGESDHSPIFKGVKDLTDLCFALLDEWDREKQGLDESIPDSMADVMENIRDTLNHHGCPPATVEEPTE